MSEASVFPPLPPGEGGGEGLGRGASAFPSPQPSPGGRGSKRAGSGTDSLLDPESLAQLGNLELIARQVVSGYMQGRHRSPHVDFALDFAQHRPYVAGDDTRRIDWRAFARNERYYVKQQEVSTNLRAHLLVDASGSMAYRGEGDAMSKFRYAQCIAASLAYLVLRQHDSAGLITFDQKFHEIVPATAAPSQLVRIVDALEKTRAKAESGLAQAIGVAAERLEARSMVVIISDLFEDADALIDSLHRLGRKRHEVILLHVMAADELHFPFRTPMTFDDLELPHERRTIDPALVREMYLGNLHEHLRAIRFAAAGLRMSYLLLETNRPFVHALGAYLAARP